MKKTVIITGASSGIGAALAIEASRRGYNLGIIARNETNLNATADSCRNLGAEVVTFVGDVSNFNDCQKFTGKVLDRFNGIDVLVNNAGISMRAVFNHTDLNVLHNLMDINFWGTVNCTKIALPEILKSKGSIVAISSIAGFRGLPGRTGYSASKFAIHGFMESLRCENLNTGIHVMLACPGYTNSNIRKSALNHSGQIQSETPLKEDKLMSSEAVAEAVWNGIDKRKRTLILTGMGKLTVLLNKFFPAFMDKKVFNYVRKEPNSPF